jgi:hypothetical protein
LQQTTGQLERVLPHAALGIVDPHPPQQLDRTLPGVPHVLATVLGFLQQKVADLLDRVDRGPWVLEHERDVAPPELAQRGSLQLSDVLAVKGDHPIHPGAWRQEPGQAPQRHRLA